MRLRESNIQRLSDGVFDVVVVGAGINGAVSAAALAAKGARVALIDRGDFAGLVSENSSNLAWGGIKYLENYEFGLVWKLCGSRNTLMRSYPSTVQEIRFLSALEPGFRKPTFLVYLGTLLYWVMGRFFTRAPALLGRRALETREPSLRKQHFTGGVEYSDAYLHDNDARFVFGFVRKAMNYGCVAANYLESLGAGRDQDGIWQIALRDTLSDARFSMRARSVVNACGPLADLHNDLSGEKTEYHHVLSKGVHLIVEKTTPHKRVSTFFADDGRMFFAIPMGPRTCIGTTDTRVDDPFAPIDEGDVDFILDNINKRLDLERPLQRSDVIATRCGVRPLAVRDTGVGQVDWVQLSRKHVVEVNDAQRHLTIFGGKLTDCLNVGDEVAQHVARLGIALPYADRLWHGEAPSGVKEEFLHQAELMRLDAMTPQSSSEPLTQRLWRRYGPNALDLLEDIRSDPTQGELLIEHAEYLRCEVAHAARREMVTRLEDFLRRRSKIALVVPHETLRRSRGLHEACRILFGAEAEAKWFEYFHPEGQDESVRTTPTATMTTA